MPKNFYDYLGNKVTFLKWEDKGLLLANFIEFFCRVLIRHCCNKFRKLIAKYSKDSKDHKGYKPKRIPPLVSVMAYYKTGTLEHRQYTEHPHNDRTTPEQRNTTGIRNNGTQNTSGTAGTPQNNGGIPE